MTQRDSLSTRMETWKLIAVFLCLAQAFQMYFFHSSGLWEKIDQEHGLRPLSRQNKLYQQDAQHVVNSKVKSFEPAQQKQQDAAADDDDEAEIRMLHQRLQTACGHRGVAAGDHSHMDSRKGPSPHTHSLLLQLEGAYTKKRLARTSFRPPLLSKRTAKWRDLEFSCFSQVGDDGLLYRIFGVLGWGNRRSLEIGYFPHEACTINLIVNANFTSVLMDGGTDTLIAEAYFARMPRYLEIIAQDVVKPKEQRTFQAPSQQDMLRDCAPYCLDSCYNVNCDRSGTQYNIPTIVRSLVTTENIGGLIERAFAPTRVQGVHSRDRLDVLSIDIDGMEYYILDTILSSGVQPRVIISEFAAHLGPALSLTRPYSATFSAAADSWQYGASLMAFIKLLNRWKYRFVGCVEWNAYFIALEDLADPSSAGAFPEMDPASCFYTDASSREVEAERRRVSLEVEWVEVEVAPPDEPRPFSQIREMLLGPEEAEDREEEKQEQGGESGVGFDR